MALFLYEGNLNLKEEHGVLQVCLTAWAVKGKDKGSTVLASSPESFLVCILLKWITFQFLVYGLKITYLGNILVLISLWAWIVTFSSPSSLFFPFFFFPCFSLFLILHFYWNSFLIQSDQRGEGETNRGVGAKWREKQSRKPAVPPDLLSFFIPAAIYYQ